MDQEVRITWKDEMAFEAEVNGHTIVIDAEEAVGGQDRGPRPKPLSLASLGGCTGMDVISILRKMRVVPDSFDISVKGELTSEHPKYYHTIRITYVFRGKDLPMDKLEKAVNLSQDRYCGVTAMLRLAAKIESVIRIED
ncbi:MAG: OsmC family protein [Bacteroidales bacterium]|nr:OsmC family protein [Bacteroidales bacterium]